MTAAKAARFPAGTLVAGLLAGNGVLWAVMFFGTLAHLQALAGGAAPFEIRPLGYSYERHAPFLRPSANRAAPSTCGPNSSSIPSYPPFYAVSRGLALWWLTMPRTALRRSRAAALALDAGGDAGRHGDLRQRRESLHRQMRASGPICRRGLVQASSLATRLKFIAELFDRSLIGDDENPLFRMCGADAEQKGGTKSGRNHGTHGSPKPERSPGTASAMKIKNTAVKLRLR